MLRSSAVESRHSFFKKLRRARVFRKRYTRLRVLEKAQKHDILWWFHAKTTSGKVHKKILKNSCKKSKKRLAFFD